MSLFVKSTGEAIEPQREVMNTGIQELIPAGTKLLCAVAGAEWVPASDFSNNHIVIMLHVIEPGAHKDKVVNHKLHVFDDKDSKADKARDMLASYDANAKGLLAKYDKANKKYIGDNQILATALNGSEILATFDVYEIESTKLKDDGTPFVNSGNWVRGISSTRKEKDAQIVAQAENRAPTTQNFSAVDAEFDDDSIPF